LRAAATDHSTKGKPARVGWDKGLGEKDYFRTLCGGFTSQATGLFNGGLAIKKNRSGLHNRDFDFGESFGHFFPPG
jgi:hypothetical protein